MRHLRKFSLPAAVAPVVVGLSVGAGIARGQVYPPQPILKFDVNVPMIKVTLTDFASAPSSGRGGSITSFGANVGPASDQIARLNFLRPEPSNSPFGAPAGPFAPTYNPTRMFSVDNNRNISILNKAALNPNTPGAGFSTYLNLQSIYPQFDNDPGYAGGLVTMAFDPDYVHNGTFYTVHTENITPTSGSTTGWLPVNTNNPAASFANYAITPAVRPPGGETRQSVLVEWHDTTPADSTFQGSARELLRLGFNGNLHPMGDLTFNTVARPGDLDYGNLYVSTGDGGSGESASNDDVVPGLTAGDRHNVPQRLDTLLGKVLRITPTHNAAGVGAAYTVPSDNPFTAASDAVAASYGARPEVFAYGFRNPHRLSFDPVSGKLIANDIGFYSFEEANIVQKGGNYGWGEREGTRAFNVTDTVGDTASTSLPGTKTGPLPATDTVPQRISTTLATTTGNGPALNNTVATDNGDGTVTSVTTYRATLNGPLTTLTAVTRGTVAVRYPVLEYFQREGDAISSGFVYRGNLMPALKGKYVFGDITTGRLFYADLLEMMAADDTNPATLANVRELQVVVAGNNTTVYDVVAAGFAAKGGDPDPTHSPNLAGVLPGFAAVVGGYHGAFDPADVVLDANGNLVFDPINAAGLPNAYGGGRADIRLAMGDDGELYLLSKSDGMIRELTGAVVVPEPAAAGLLAGASLLLPRRRRRS